MPPEAGTNSAKHETVDANIRSLVHWGIGVFALLLAGFLVSLATFRYFIRTQGLGPPASPFENSRTLPPAPRLQVTPARDLQQYRDEQRQTLETYGWVDQRAGIVRVPIERAMDLVIEQGTLKARSHAPESAQHGMGAGEETAVPAKP